MAWNVATWQHRDCGGKSVPPLSAPIAVIIVNWHTEKLLERCLAALAQQTLLPQQIMVIDNASQNNALRECEQRYPNVQFIQSEENIGFAAASNVGVQAAHESDWVALLNPDAFPQPGWLAALWRAVQQYPDYTFFGSCLLRAACPTQIDGIGDTYHVSGLAWRQDHSRPVSAEARVGREIFAPCAAAALYRRDAFLAVNGFDELYFCYGEDIDLAFRLRLMAQRCWYVPDAVVHHIGSASTAPKSDFSLYYGHRNLMWTYIKNMPSPLVWYYLPQRIVMWRLFTKPTALPLLSRSWYRGIQYAPHGFHADYRPSYRKQWAEDGWNRMQVRFIRNGLSVQGEPMQLPKESRQGSGLFDWTKQQTGA